MKISVVAIFYNSENYVHRCLDSILEQRDVQLEIIAVNDYSSDMTGDILDRYALLHENLHVIHHPSNKGISAARNSGLEKISGDCFYFIDGDDYLATAYSLSHLAAKFSKDVDFIQGSYCKCQENSGELLGDIIFNNKTYDSFANICNHFGELNFYYTHNKLINAKYKNIKFITGYYHEDRMWMVEIFNRLNRIISIDVITYNYIIRAGQESNRARSTKLYIDSGMKLMHMMAKSPDCWQNIRDTFQIVDIEKPLYLWSNDPTYRKTIIRQLRLLNTPTIPTKGFPRFTRFIHLLITCRFPDILINFFSKFYLQVMQKLNRKL